MEPHLPLQKIVQPVYRLVSYMIMIDNLPPCGHVWHGCWGHWLSRAEMPRRQPCRHGVEPLELPGSTAIPCDRYIEYTLQGMDTYPTLGSSENHLQNAILGGYVSSLEGI